MKKHFQVIAFDADDTLWVNEPYFRESEQAFCRLLSSYMPEDEAKKVLFKTEVRNMPLYGYGVKAFVLSMMETAIEIAGNKLTADVVEHIIQLGRNQLNKEVVLLDGVGRVLQQLHDGGQKMVVVTKGDLLDQERKLAKSGLDHFFHHVEIMSEKHSSDYLKLLGHLDIQSSDFLMIGNSMKSDVLPVLEIGGYAIHIPFHETWEYERTDIKIEHPHFQELEQLSDLIEWLQQ